MSLTRRLILAAALIAGIAPTFGQSPPPVPALPDTERRTSYSISGTTCNCAVGFQLFGDSTDVANWLEVFVNGVLVPQAGNWTITSPTGSLATISRPITDAVLTFTAAQTGTVQIVGARRPRRTTQFQESQPVPTRNLNQTFSDIIATQRELWDKTNDFTGRGLFSQPGVTMGLLPTPAQCASMFLAFDATGLIPKCVQLLTSGGIATPGTTVVNDLAAWGSITGNQLIDLPPRNLPAFTTDSGGSPGLAGIVPAPPAGAAAGGFVLQPGGWAAQSATGALVGPYGEPWNLQINATVSGNNLTVALKGNNGSDASGTNPISIPFRSATLNSGAVVWRQITTAKSFTVNSGNTLGFTSNVPGRLWVVAVDNGGSVEIGLINCSAAGSFYPLSSTFLKSTTGGNGGNAAGNIYNTTGVSNKAITVLGFLTWETALPTAGTWSAGPDQIQLYGGNVPLPGRPTGLSNLGTVVTTTGNSFTSQTYVASNLACVIQPQSKANFVSVYATGGLLASTTSDIAKAIIQRGGVNVGIGQQTFANGANGNSNIMLIGTDTPGSIALLTYTVMVLNTVAGHNLVFPANSTGETGGLITCSEIMG